MTAPDRGTQQRGRRADKRAAMLARRIEADIAAAGWRVGSVIGTESELMERYGVSRAVFRETVRLVEHHRAAHMRRGPGGGLVVQAPDGHGAMRALVIYLEGAGTSVANLIDVRRILEPLAVSLASDRLSEAGIQTLRDSVAREIGGDGSAARSMPDQVHRAIAAMSHNAVLQLFLDILEELSERYATRPAGINESSVEAIDRDIRRGHHEMVDAIIEGDTARAQRLTIEHLDSIADLLSSNVRNRRAWAAPVPVDVESEASGKLGVLLAEQIRRDLGSENRAVGDLIGSESALMQRYGVSRQILREAVRLLEHHGIAVMRRGASGGLTVAQPDPQASIDAVSVYLQYRNVDVADLRSVRNAIELACIDLVVARHDEPDVTTRLREALAVDQSATTDNVIASVHELHRELAEITGNPVLALFLNVLTSLWERRSVHCPPEAPPADTQMLSALQDAHTGIVEAVLDGDRGLARLRMLRHVEVLTAWWH